MNEPLPHSGVFRLLQSICPAHLYEEIEGDLLQKYEKDVATVGKRRAGLRLVWNAVRFFRPGIIFRHKSSWQPNSISMITSHFKVAFRHIVKDKKFSAINVLGLAVGIATATLILQFLDFELRYDQFHQNKDEIYRLTYSQQVGDKSINSAEAFYGASSFAKENFPEVKHLIRVYKWPASTGLLLLADGRFFNERNYLFADSAFFEVFPSLLAEGQASGCLSDPHAIVVSKKLALKMFGTTDVLGRIIMYMDRPSQVVTITGIMNDLPANSHFAVDAVRPYEKDWIPAKGSEWRTSWWTYLTIDRDVNINSLEERFNTALTRNQKDNAELRGVRMAFQPITDIHFSQGMTNEIRPGGKIVIVYVMAAVVFMIMLIAWINYVNLETARFMTRVKEVGIRRITGASKFELVSQFLIQYFCINVLAIVIAGLIIYAATPYYSLITGIDVEPEFSFSSFWKLSLLVFLAGSMLTGIYPVLVLMKINPAASLKGQLARVGKGLWLRRTLLVFQFTSSITLIAFLWIISGQLEFMRNTNSNFNVDDVLTVYNPTNYSVYEDSLRKEKNDFFRHLLLQNKSIASLTTSSAIPGEPVGFTYVDLAKKSLSDPDRLVPYKVIYVDDNFVPLFGLKLKAGRNYSTASQDHNCLVVTESAIKELGFSSSEEAVGKEIYFMEDDWDKWKIIGVVEDYRHESVKTRIYPTIFRFHRNKGQMVYYSVMKAPGARADEVVTAVQTAWNETWPEKSFDYFFLDSFYDQQFKSEIQFGRIFMLFAAVAVFIACIGILGMTLFEANARVKEFSIRKVLGASVVQLLAIMGRTQILAITLAAMISVPVIYFGAVGWLTEYPVQMPLSAIYFVGPLGIVLMIVLITSGLQAMTAATVNPVEHLKNE